MLDWLLCAAAAGLLLGGCGKEEKKEAKTPKRQVKDERQSDAENDAFLFAVIDDLLMDDE